MDPHDTPSQFSHGVPTQPTSRRRFLKAAVVGGAAVAAGAASGAAGIALASKGSPVPRILNTFNPGGPLSGRQQYTMCGTDSGCTGTSSITVKQVGNGQYKETPGTLFIWLTAHSLPYLSAGYKLDITMDYTSADPTSSSDPFELAANGNGNAAFLFQFGAWDATDCPGASICPGSTNAPTPARSQDTEADLYTAANGGAYNWSSTLGAQDLQQYVHIVWNPSFPLTTKTTYTFSGTVKDGNGNLIKSLPSAVSITANPG